MNQNVCIIGEEGTPDCYYFDDERFASQIVQQKRSNKETRRQASVICFVCGRLKSDYRYSGNIVYNNFVWPKPNPNQVMKIESTAPEILKVREKYMDMLEELTAKTDGSKKKR